MMQIMILKDISHSFSTWTMANIKLAFILLDTVQVLQSFSILSFVNLHISSTLIYDMLLYSHKNVYICTYIIST